MQEPFRWACEVYDRDSGSGFDDALTGVETDHLRPISISISGNADRYTLPCGSGQRSDLGGEEEIASLLAGPTPLAMPTPHSHADLPPLEDAPFIGLSDVQHILDTLIDDGQHRRADDSTLITFTRCLHVAPAR